MKLDDFTARGQKKALKVWSVLGNVLIVLALSAALGAGIALFVIARQDVSRTGKVLGVLIVVAAISMAIYVVLGQHWL